MTTTIRRDAILALNDLPAPQLVDVPEWGGSIYIRALTGVERDAYEAQFVRAGGAKGKGLHNARARLVALTAVDETGQRIFTDADVESLGRKSAMVLDRLFAVAGRLSGLTSQDVEELVGNSVSGPSAASTSDSPSPSA